MGSFISMLQKDVRPIISVKEARKILGIKAKEFSDDEIATLIHKTAQLTSKLWQKEQPKHDRLRQ